MVKNCRITCDWTFKGMRTLILENKVLKIVSLLDKGSDIVEFLYKPLDIDFLWHSPIGYKIPNQHIESCSIPEGNFSEYYEGGWQDVLPNAGLNCEYAGARFGMHGETPLMRWDCVIEKDDPDEVIAHLWVKCCRYPLKVDKWLKLRVDEEYLLIRERVTNESATRMPFSWLQHIVLGEPFVTPGCRIDLAADEVVVAGPQAISKETRLKPGGRFKWPKAGTTTGKSVDLSVIPSKEIKSHDLAFITALKKGSYKVINPDLKLGFGVDWDEKVFRCVWLWQPLGTSDHPWYGRAWATGLEPCSSWPETGLADYVKRGTALMIDGNSSIETEIKAKVYANISPQKEP